MLLAPLAVGARRCELGLPKPDAAFKVVKVVAPDVRRRNPANTANTKPGARYCPWTQEEDALLGKFTDEEVTHKLG
jgi:hypothetical protein